MNLKTSIIAFALALLGLAAVVPEVLAGDYKVGAVNAAKLLEEAPQAEAARKRLEKEFAPRDEKLVALQKEIKQQEEKLKRDGAVMSDAEQRKVERNVRSNQRDLKRLEDEFREDFNIRRNEEFSKLQRRVYEAIVAHAKEEKYDLIIGDGVIYASDKVDITSELLKRLKAEFNGQATKAAPKAGK